MGKSENLVLTEEKQPPRRLFLPSLALSYFAIFLPMLILGLVLVDIGETFNRPVGLVGQLQTIAAFVSAITALLMGVWSVRYKHKSLLLIGLVIIMISAVGSSLAFNFYVLLIIFALSGFGVAMGEPMVFSLIGEHLPLGQRARTISWIITGFALASAIGVPIVGVIIGVGGWRWAFFGFMLPSAFLSLVLAATGVPSSPTRNPHPKNKVKNWAGFRGIFANRSATVCLIATMFLYAGWQALLVYGVSFLRERLEVPVEFASIIIVCFGLFYALGGQVGGRMVNWLGMKPATVVTVFFTGIFVSSYTIIHKLWLVVPLMSIGYLFGGMRITASSSLTLEQEPSFRGTMMSLNSVVGNLGIMIGAGAGGFVLLFLDYEGVGVIVGSLNFVAALIFYLLVNDPTSETD